MLHQGFGVSPLANGWAGADRQYLGFVSSFAKENKTCWIILTGNENGTGAG
jgi:hypothetical protein